MKIFDMLGNEVHTESLLYWKSLGAIVKVKGINQVPLKMNDKTMTAGELILELKLPFDASRPENYLKEFVAVVDPDMQQKVEEIANAASVRPER